MVEVPPAARTAALDRGPRGRASGSVNETCPFGPSAAFSGTQPANADTLLAGLELNLPGPNGGCGLGTAQIISFTPGSPVSLAARPEQARVPSSPTPTGSWPPCFTCADFAHKQSWPNCSPWTAAGSPRPSAKSGRFWKNTDTPSHPRPPGSRTGRRDRFPCSRGRRIGDPDQTSVLITCEPLLLPPAPAATAIRGQGLAWCAVSWYA